VDYQNILKIPNPTPAIVTRLLDKKTIAYEKSRQAANDSTKANRRAKISFHNTVNNTMGNPSISAKKKFSILIRLVVQLDLHCCITVGVVIFPILYIFSLFIFPSQLLYNV